MYYSACRGRPAPLLVGFACAAVLLLTAACHRPRETRSVHLPLAVGNRWVYDVESDSSQGTAVIEVVSRDKEAYGLSMSGDFGHLTGPDSLLRLKCRDSILYLLTEVNGRTRWFSILSDDPSDSCTQTLLLYREPSRSQFSLRPIGTVVVGGDTFQDCLRLSCWHVHEASVVFLNKCDTSWVTEDYAPRVGVVRMAIEHHWWSWGWFFGFYSGSGMWVDRWELRNYSLADE